MDRHSPWCDISIIWARDLGDNQSRRLSSRTRPPRIHGRKKSEQIALKVVQNGLITMETAGISGGEPPASR